MSTVGQRHTFETQGDGLASVRKNFHPSPAFRLIEFKTVPFDLRRVRLAHQLHPDEVRSDAFNLREHEFLAGQRHGDDQNDGSAPDNHAQRRQDRAQFIRSPARNSCFHRLRA